MIGKFDQKQGNISNFSINRGMGCFERASHAQNTPLPPSFLENTISMFVPLR
jgi:hypothetical protein